MATEARLALSTLSTWKVGTELMIYDNLLDFSITYLSDQT